jgi:hypothetical protein
LPAEVADEREALSVRQRDEGDDGAVGVAGSRNERAVAVKGWLGGFEATGQLGTSEVRLRLGFIDRDGHDASFLMISPLLHDDPLTALRGQRAFEIARATFTPLPTGAAATGS